MIGRKVVNIPIGWDKRSNGLEGCLGKAKTGKIDYGTVASKRLAY